MPKNYRIIYSDKIKIVLTCSDGVLTGHKRSLYLFTT